MLRKTEMNQLPQHLKIRRFQAADAEFCWRIRCEAFRERFLEEIGEKAMSAGVRAYSPDDYTRFSREKTLFILEEQDKPVGFFIVSRTNHDTAELFLIYIDLRQLKRGLGQFACLYMENWITRHWRAVSSIVVDTIIPDYNGRFYQKMGYEFKSNVNCNFCGESVAGIRYQKLLNRFEEL